MDLTTLPLPSAEEAARFLGHATLGYSMADVNDLRLRGYAAWFDTQFALFDRQRANPNVRHLSHLAWMKAKTPPREEFSPGDNAFAYGQITQSALRRAVEATDGLTQRMTFALSQILVVSIRSSLGLIWPQFAGATYLDMLQRHSLGNYNALLGDVSRHPAMSRFLTFKGSMARTAATSPDENYARELMQLFTLGVVQLNDDGTPHLGADGLPQETFRNADVRELARVFTGWVDALDDPFNIEALRLRNVNIDDGIANDTAPLTLALVPGRTETLTDPDPERRLDWALDHLFAHPNVAPFISRQLIQRLVTSNPSSAYVRRVATEFRASGGNLKRVAQAILMDDSLFDAQGRRRGGLGDAVFGRLREPWCRLVHWARGFGATSRSGTWRVGQYEQGLELADQLGQAPMLAPTVFNFFRPGYVPPASVTAARRSSDGQALVAPEFQITDEVSVVAYINFMSDAIDPGLGVSRLGDVIANYSAWLGKASNPTALMDDINILLTAGRLKAYPANVPTPNYTRIRNAIATLPVNTDAQRRVRVQAAILMVMASPEFLVQQ